MVQAILDGRKTQTRRLTGLNEINENPDEWILIDVGPITINGTITKFGALFQNKKEVTNVVFVPSPYGQPSDKLWGRETWKPCSWDENTGWIRVTFKDGTSGRKFELDDPDMFERLWISISDEFDRKGMEPVDIIGDEEYGVYSLEQVAKLSWRPSIHMPKAAARIWLEVESVGVERLQEISEKDAIAEGYYAKPSKEQLIKVGGYYATTKAWYCKLWESINGPGSWGANPWVWVVKFKVRANFQVREPH